MAGGPDPGDLLQHHIPVLRYDSQEPYFADAAAEWTDNPGNELRRADGTVIAAASPAGDQPLLSLSFLDPGGYPGGQPVAHNDRIADPSHDYVAQARALHAQPQYANVVYGHWATGSDDRIWLAYWFFYFYNDYNLIGPLIKAGLHEGDWEMIQLRLDADGLPTEAPRPVPADSIVIPRPELSVSIGSNPTVYAFERGDLRRNIYRIPLH